VPKINLYQRLLYDSVLRRVNALEPWASKLSDGELQDETYRLRERRERGESHSKLLPRMYALVREASKRTLNMRHFDVQILGGAALHYRSVAEMETGEGKTIVATLAACLHALDGKGVHVVTVNDYLVDRDAEWMRPIYETLGFSVGKIL